MSIETWVAILVVWNVVLSYQLVKTKVYEWFLESLFIAIVTEQKLPLEQIYESARRARLRSWGVRG